MSEIIIPLDQIFAKQIDANCDLCLQGEGNSKQKRDLEKRGIESPYPSEKKALKKYIEKCQYCFEQGPEFINSLEATRSCDYRIGI